MGDPMTIRIYAEPASADEPVVKLRGAQLALALLGAVLGSWVITILVVEFIADLVWTAIRAALFVVGVLL